MQTQIRLLLEEQSDEGFHCLLFHLHLFDEIPKGLASFLEFYGVFYSKVFSCSKIYELYGNTKHLSQARYIAFNIVYYHFFGALIKNLPGLLKIINFNTSI